MAFHHLALATNDMAATHRFYTEAMGFELVKTVVAPTPSGKGWAKHVFYDTGGDGMIAFWDLHDERVVASYPLEVDVVRRIADALRQEMPDLGFAVETVSAGFAHEPTYQPRWSLDPQTVVAELETLLSGPVTKLLARHEGLTADELLHRAREVVGTDLASLTHSSREGLLEISAAGVTKASTLTAVCAEHGYAADDVVAFGDMPNDLPMLAWAGHGVAVANAHPSVLAAVDEVTASNDDDGVAQVLERWF
jgi:hydroxymethylpyrimidine pyrophosphatase-like HAD family hydrolase